jgi:hypothetical protein
MTECLNLELLAGLTPEWCRSLLLSWGSHRSCFRSGQRGRHRMARTDQIPLKGSPACEAAASHSMFPVLALFSFGGSAHRRDSAFQ